MYSIAIDGPAGAGAASAGAGGTGYYPGGGRPGDPGGRADCGGVQQKRAPDGQGGEIPGGPVLPA